MAETYSAGIVTAYGAAVRGGYDGTYEQWCEDMAQLGDNVAEVREKAEQVEQTAQEFTEQTVPAAIQSVEDKGTEQVNAVGTAGATQVQEINDTAVLRIGAVNAAGAAQVQAVEDAGDDVTEAVEDAGTAATSDIDTAKAAALTALQNESFTQQTAIQQKGETTRASIPDDYTALSDEVVELKSAFDTFVNTREVLASTYQTVLPDANTAPYNSIYRIFISARATAYTANLPADFVKNAATSDRRGILITLATKTGNPFLVQTLVSENNIYRRFKLTPTGSFSEWTGFTEKLLKEYSTYSNSTNGALSDLDNAELNTFYNFFYVPNFAPANMPGDITQYRQGLIVTYGNTQYKLQFVLISNQYYTRLFSGSAWGPWLSVTDLFPKTYIVGAQDSLVSAIDTARAANRFCTIKVSGTHNILSEMQAAHPNDWSTLNDKRGLLIQDMHIIFDSTAKIVCNYTGNDTDVLEMFSVFDIRYGSEVILENVNIEASRIRYCVHDDRFNATRSYKNAYINCNMRIDNSNNTIRSMYPHCIGGGFGANSLITIENCVFEGVGGADSGAGTDNNNAIVSWHNSPNASAFSKLAMTGCYFRGDGTFRAMCNGTSTDKSIVLLSGNYFGSAPFKGYISGQSVDNMELLETVNAIRT